MWKFKYKIDKQETMVKQGVGGGPMTQLPPLVHQNGS